MDRWPQLSRDPRVALANERTLLSWIRLALALVGAGTTIGTVADIHPVWLHVMVAVVPVMLGLVAALLGYALAARRRSRPRRASRCRRIASCGWSP